MVVVMDPVVTLVSMPWAPAVEPSLALGILTAQMRRHDIACRAIHASSDLLRFVTYPTYTAVAEFWGLNEFVFTGEISPGLDERQRQRLIDRCFVHAAQDRPAFQYKTVPSLMDMLLRFRDEVAPEYLNACCDRVLENDPTLVGFTCMFDQTLASVALARIIKHRSPQTMVVLGGYAVQGPPGRTVLESFEWIDGVAQGDGKKVILDLAAASVGRVDLRDIHGLLVRNADPRPQQSFMLEASPDPDYHDWLADLARLKNDHEIEISFDTYPVESSRGCWWGQHKHCVFCGIDEETLKFRNKSGEKVTRMLHGMRERYGDAAYRFSDYILPQTYFKTLMPELSGIDPKFRLKCEIKANQSGQRMTEMAKAGFFEVQPGIESFSTNVLKLMDKGVSGIQNVALLKYGFLERVIVHYNFLYGIPGETLSDYEEMVERLPLLYHFTPPVSRTEAIITRFAPMHENASAFGCRDKPVHHASYDVLFSEDILEQSGFLLDDYAYYFERYFDFTPEMAAVYGKVVRQINHWKKLHRERSVLLTVDDLGDRLEVTDTRHLGPRTYTLPNLESRVYRLCDEKPVTIEAIVASAETFDADPLAVRDALARLEGERLLWREGSQIFGLATPGSIAHAHVESNWNKRWTAIYR
ncbi:RiPP maturation radical SAM C-methyltransferase [uncultured Jannaschia sp.]|uniref:RiPP maturation radical SAM C-methyltransferase n=1 Tax=uncultured Jannaschia sp. TaxID=293347 RepID=UPI002627E9EB|nr:RiPP maturation radical SAM C-methyltransferase [uncultured Jannaschia sp.]